MEMCEERGAAAAACSAALALSVCFELADIQKLLHEPLKVVPNGLCFEPANTTHNPSVTLGNRT